MLYFSLLYEMRLTAHLELAKICAQLHQLQAALDHLQKVQSVSKTMGIGHVEVCNAAEKHCLESDVTSAPFTITMSHVWGRSAHACDVVGALVTFLLSSTPNLL